MSIEAQFTILHMLTDGIIVAGMSGWWLTYQNLKRKERRSERISG